MNNTRLKQELGPPVTSSLTGLEADDEAETAMKQSPAEGSERAVQTLYEGPPKCNCCKNWVEEYPDDLRKAIEEQPETKQKALVVRMGKNHGEGKLLVVHSIVVQSHLLKRTLGDVFKGYQGITPGLKKLIFRSPFHMFYYRWAVFTEILAVQNREDLEAAGHSQLLYDILEVELKDLITEVADLKAHNVMTYPLLWALFEPGSEIIAEVDNCYRFFLVDEYQYNDFYGFLGIKARFVDFDGSHFGYVTQMLRIPRYAGTLEIQNLDVMPAALHPLSAELKSKAIARGERFRALRDFHYMAYSGTTRCKGRTGSYGERKHDGRIVVDAASFFASESSRRIVVTDLDSRLAEPNIRVTDDEHIGHGGKEPGHRRGPGAVRDPRQMAALRGFGLEHTPVEPIVKKSEHPLSDEHLALCNSHVRGYSLKLKCWAEFDVEKVDDIAWNDEAFPNLMLPNGYKNLILSFVEGQTTGKSTFDDIIEGKGLGVIMLLVGNPGTGKTLTAEAVADKVRRPLYVMSAGELGNTAEDVESRLSTVLNLTEKWQAVLLFDECDVFLQERSSRDLEHNEIVAVFLRLLEYFRGILVMTSNRSDIIDRAFESRIHLKLHYPDLAISAKDHIWRHFTAKAGSEMALTDDEYHRLARLPLNGRQIKNTIKIATLLAVQENEHLGMQHVATVLQATNARGVMGEVVRKGVDV